MNTKGILFSTCFKRFWSIELTNSWLQYEFTRKRIFFRDLQYYYGLKSVYLYLPKQRLVDIKMGKVWVRFALKKKTIILKQNFYLLCKWIKCRFELSPTRHFNQKFPLMRCRLKNSRQPPLFLLGIIGSRWPPKWNPKNFLSTWCKAWCIDKFTTSFCSSFVCLFSFCLSLSNGLFYRFREVPNTFSVSFFVERLPINLS